MSKDKKTSVEKLKEELFYDRKNATLIMDDAEIETADEYCEGYKNFLDNAKTEREAVSEAVKMAEAKGFRKYKTLEKLKVGDKIYHNNRDKALLLMIVGTRQIADGLSIIASHIDSPRLDLKPNPLYEDGSLAYFDTHYYGGIKKYQWTAMPLSIHGVVIKKDGTKVNIVVGEDEKDSVFCVTDLLPHLASQQMQKKAGEFIPGDDLNVLIGSRPFKNEKESELVKLNIMKIINEKYGITERDFQCAELEVVPAYKARDVGFDRSMVGGYGQDDRVCAYPSLTAIFSAETPEYTTAVFLADKEETGSDGVTGMQSKFFKYFVNDVAESFGEKGSHVLSNSVCLSADVNLAFDPIFPEVVDKNNCAKLNGGVVLMKYSGSRGKGGTSDASAELVRKVGNIFDGNNVLWQVGELGKVDAGGGGTVAMYIANLNVDTVDLGVSVLSMHAPFEVTSKLDIYMAHKAFTAFITR